MIWKTYEKEMIFQKFFGGEMTDFKDFHVENRMNKDMELGNSSDSGLEECSTSPGASSSRLSESPTSNFEMDNTKPHIPFRPQIITPSESSAFSKIQKLVGPSQEPSVFPPLNLGAPPSVGYLPGLLIPPWMVNNEMYKKYLPRSHIKTETSDCGPEEYKNYGTRSPIKPETSDCGPEEYKNYVPCSYIKAETSDCGLEEKNENETNKNVFTEVNTSIPFTNYFQNLTKLLSKATSEDGRQLEQEDSIESEPGEITKRHRPEQLNLYNTKCVTDCCNTNVQPGHNIDQNEILNRQSITPPTGFLPSSHVFSMAPLLGQHPYPPTSATHIPQLPTNSQMLQYFGGVQPPTGLLHPALLHMAGLRNRRMNTEKPPPVKKYKCDVCGKAFSRSNTLVTHKRIHTGDKPFKCEVCGRAFRQPGNLTRHRLTHTTVKPYVCPSCNKAFNRASNLHTHMRTHTNFKPFTCPYCGKGFHQKIDMKIHCYTHTGERPHRCDICGKGFTLISTLNAHRRIHTENIPVTEMA